MPKWKDLAGKMSEENQTEMCNGSGQNQSVKALNARIGLCIKKSYEICIGSSQNLLKYSSSNSRSLLMLP